ncbi:MAG: hypothetical protein KA788_11250 [Lacunisphaera sp.]|nr:hypothetical protein [Lacunisphaera sp.]
MPEEIHAPGDPGLAVEAEPAEGPGRLARLGLGPDDGFPGMSGMILAAGKARRQQRGQQPGKTRGDVLYD